MDYKCLRCDSTCVEMTHFYICPNCMADYATNEQLEYLYTLWETTCKNEKECLRITQHMVDADKERLRLMQLHQEHFKMTLDMIGRRLEDG